MGAFNGLRPGIPLTHRISNYTPETPAATGFLRFFGIAQLSFPTEMEVSLRSTNRASLNRPQC
jgi:hypothetical protein